MITFEKCRWKNLLSTGNYFTEIDFKQHKKTLIVGTNGSGKSTVLDALTFALFGKPFRKINKPTLVNSINGSNCLVEVEFSIGIKKYKIQRGIKPNVFNIFCDGVQLNKDSKTTDFQEYLENTILKFNYKSFTQIVILGSAAFVPFMQLVAADRRAIIEELLDIQIFTAMNSLVKEKTITLKDSVSDLKYNIELLNEKIILQNQSIELSKKNTKEEVDKNKEEIQKIEKEIEKKTNDIDLINKHLDTLRNKIVDVDKIKNKRKSLFNLESKIENTIKNTQRDIEFFHNNETCPTCTQKLDLTFREEQKNIKNSKLEELNDGLKSVEKEISNAEKRLEEIEEISKNILDHSNEIVNLTHQISASNNLMKKINEHIQKLLERNDSFDFQENKLSEFKKEKEELENKLKEFLEEREYLDVCSMMLKDSGIKTQIIKQYIPIMNKVINKYLKDMDFFVSFNLDENFNETIKSRHHDEFSYPNFSEGEKMKIDLALLFAWRHISKLKNSINTNLLILDEIFDSSLDNNSVDAVLKIFSELGTDTNLFVISHRGDQLVDKFDNLITFEKKNSFSRMS